MTAVVLCLAALAALAAAAPATQKYNSHLDQIQIDAIIGNPRVMRNYVKCMTDKGPCTSEGKEIKKILPEVLATNCAKCSPQLRTNLKKTVTAMREKYPEEWSQVVKKYDPKKEHTKALEKFMKE